MSNTGQVGGMFARKNSNHFIKRSLLIQSLVLLAKSVCATAPLQKLAGGVCLQGYITVKKVGSFNPLWLPQFYSFFYVTEQFLLTFTNDLENQIKFLICLESKAGSGTSLCLMMQTISDVTKLSQNNLCIFTVIIISGNT